MRVALLTGLAVAAMAASVLYASGVQRQTARAHAAEDVVTQNLLTDVYRSESSLETYALTGDREPLADRELALRRLENELASARRQAGDDRRASALVADQRRLVDQLEGIASAALAASGDRRRRGALRRQSDRRHHIVDRVAAANTALRDRQSVLHDREDHRASLVAPALILVLGLVFGSGAVVAMRRERARARKRVESRVRQERFGEAMQVTESQAEAHELLKSHLEDSLPGATVTVLNRNNSADRLEATTSLPEGSPLAEQLKDARPRSCMAVRLSRPFAQGGCGTEVFQCRVCRGVADETTCQPLLVGGEVIGSVLSAQDEALDEEGGERIAQSVAQSAPVLANLRNLAIAETRAATDALTGLPNRRAVDDTLLRMLAQAGRSFDPLSVILLDLDHFKVINDTHGHDRGDEVLAGVGARLRELIRESDFAGRSGGEEFVLFLAGTERAGAVRVAEKARAALHGLRVSGVERDITASFGIACFPEDAVDAAALMRSADRALYAAKRAGRDRIEGSSAGAVPEAALPD